jgi:hypothetical protein
MSLTNEEKSERIAMVVPITVWVPVPLRCQDCAFVMTKDCEVVRTTKVGFEFEDCWVPAGAIFIWDERVA